MSTPICDCGSSQVNYIGIDDVEGHSLIELFKCEECGTYIEVRTAVKIDGQDDPWQDVPDGTYDPKPSEYGASDLP